MQLPSLDSNVCAQWSEQDVDKYNKLPVWLAAEEAAFRRDWLTWPKFFKKRPWTPNVGETLRLVMNERAPLGRQRVYPSRLSESPLVDVVNYNERTVDAAMHWHDFESPVFSFLPSFQDFMSEKFNPNRESLQRDMAHWEECFVRTWMLQKSPYVYICGQSSNSSAGLQLAPHVTSEPDGTTGKTDAWFESFALPNTTDYLTFAQLYQALNAFTDEVGATPFEGSGLPKGMSQALDEKYCLVTQSPVWRSFTDDPWLKENKPINMDHVTGQFRGDIFGELTTKIERFGPRIKAAMSGQDVTISWPAPETTELNSSDIQYNRTIPNPDYASPRTGAQYMISWLVGGRSYAILDAGPPPSSFTKSADTISKMEWNGQINLTDKILIPCKDDSGDTHWKFNTRGRYRQLVSSLSTGIIAVNAFNVMPIIHQRPQRELTVLTATGI